MISCIWAFYLALASSPGAAAVPQPPAASVAAASDSDPDQVYAKREDLPAARRAAAIWEERLRTNGRDFESAWKLARARYWLGGHAPDGERKALLEAGIEVARLAVALAPGKPEGHFWLAANMGGLAESYGLRQGLKYRGDIKQELLTVLALDRAFQYGSADRALGRWYAKVPGMFGGSKAKSEEHLRRSLTYGAESTASRFFLAETLLAQNRRAEARVELQRVLDAPVHPGWEPEDREFKARARRVMAEME